MHLNTLITPLVYPSITKRLAHRAWVKVEIKGQIGVDHLKAGDLKWYIPDTVGVNTLANCKVILTSLASLRYNWVHILDPFFRLIDGIFIDSEARRYIYIISVEKCKMRMKIIKSMIGYRNLSGIK